MNRENQEGPDIGAFLVASLLHFYSGQPLQNLSGVDMVRGALELVRAKGLKVLAKCPFVAAFMAKHSEFNDLL